MSSLGLGSDRWKSAVALGIVLAGVQLSLTLVGTSLPEDAEAGALYALYHVGYGMSGLELVFLFGLGTVYAVAYALVRNGLVLWPLLTPLGSFFNNLNNAQIELPWASILGFLDVLAVMAAVLWLARRRSKRKIAAAPASGEREPASSG